MMLKLDKYDMYLYNISYEKEYLFGLILEIQNLFVLLNLKSS